MAAAVRPSSKGKKIAYDILKTPKNLRQYTEMRPTKKQQIAWYKDTSISQ